jgi:hypothetical protein
MKQLLSSKRNLVFLFCALLYIFSFGLRAKKLSHISPFSDDMARDAFIVMQHIQERKPFVLGPKASVGPFYVQPLYYYLLAIPLGLTGGDPDAASMMIVLLESLTPVLIYLLVRRYWSEAAGQVAGVLYAVSPLTITFGSYAWSPNLIPLVSTISFFCVSEYLLKKSRKAIIGAVIAGVCAFQFHYQGMILLLFLASVFVYSLLFDRKAIKWWFFASVAGALTFLPLLFDLEITKGNIISIYLFFTQDHSRFYQTIHTFPFFWNELSRFFEHAVSIETGGYLFGRVFYLGSILVLAITMILTFFRKKKIELTADLLLLWMLTISFIGLRSYKGDKLEYYLLFLFPFPAILFSAVYAKLKGKVRTLGLLGISLIVFHASFIYPPYVHEKQRDYDTLRSFVQYVDREVPKPYSVVSIPYLFFKQPIEFAWISEKKEDITVEKDSFAQYAVYFCHPDQHCGDGPFLSQDNENPEYISQIEDDEYRLGGKLYKTFRYEQEQIRIDVVTYQRDEHAN